MERDIKIATEAGERNLATMQLVRNWCAHARIKKFGGTGLIEQATGLPIGNHGLECDLKNPAANGECGAINNNKFGTLNVVTRYADDVLSGFGNRQYNWQGSAVVQHELVSGVGLQVSYFRTWFGNFTVTQNTAVSPSDFTSFCVTAPSDSALPSSGIWLCG